MEIRFRQLITDIENWGRDRDLLQKSFAPKQYLKFLEEVGETARALLKDDQEEIIDGFGDIAVTIIILNKQISDTVKFIHIDFNETIGEEDFGFDDLFVEVNPKQVTEYALYALARISESYGYELLDCMKHAFEVIKFRTGKTIDGVYKKD